MKRHPWDCFGLPLQLAAALLLMGFSSQTARADIVSVTGTGPLELPIGSISSGGSQVLAASWSSVNSYTGVDISALLLTEIFSGNPTGDATGEAYLMNEIGTTTAKQIAAASFTVLSTYTSPTMVNLFSGVNLGPGTYYLVLDNPIGSPRFYWVTASSPTIAADSGTTYRSDYLTGDGNLTYPPDSDFAALSRTDRLEFTVTGTLVSDVPETASVFVLGAMLLILGTLGRRVKLI